MRPYIYAREDQKPELDRGLWEHDPRAAINELSQERMRWWIELQMVRAIWPAHD